MDSQSAVAAYASRDFSLGGEAYQHLLSAVDDEADDAFIKLSDHVGKMPPNLTPAMLRWYGAFVAGARQAALDAVEAQAGLISKSKGAAGIFLERQLDAIADRQLESKRQTLSAHLEQNSARYDRLAGLQRDAERALRQYDNLHAQHNRSPREVPFWYLPLLLLLLVAEGFINYEALLSVKIMTPFTAFGTVVVLGFVLAYASHLHGKLLRQARVLFDPSQNDIDRLVGWRMLGLGTVALSIVLGVVAYARGIYLSDEIDLQAVLGGEPPNWIGVVGGSLLGNVAVWIGGVIVAFAVHDPDPHFPESLADRDKKAAAVQQLREALDKPLQRDFERTDAAAQRQIETARNHEASMAHLPAHQDLRRDFERVMGQDARVLGLLDNYRGKLVSRLRGRDVTFERASELDTQQPEALSAAEYAGEPLRLKYL